MTGAVQSQALKYNMVLAKASKKTSKKVEPVVEEKTGFVQKMKNNPGKTAVGVGAVIVIGSQF